MKKFTLLLCLVFIPVFAEYTLVISKVEINAKKSNGKSWDAFGKPDLIVSVYS